MLFSEFIKQLNLHPPQELPSLYIFTGPGKLVSELKEKGLKILTSILVKDKRSSDPSDSEPSGRTCKSNADHIEIKRFDITNFNEAEFWNDVYAVPFLNKPRLVILNIGNKTDFIGKIDESLKEYISTKSFFTKLVIFVDKWENYSESLGRLANKKVWIIDYQPISQNDLPKWISAELKLYGKEISFRDAVFIAERTGNNLSEIDAVIQKLVLFHKDSRNISNESVCNFVDVERDYDIKELGEALVNKQTDRALIIVNQLLRKGESVNKIIGYLRWFFSNNYRYQNNQRLLSYYYEKLLEYDLAIKTGLLPDDLALQMLAIKLSRPSIDKSREFAPLKRS
jgi:DNA polymerase III delta subunit